MPRSKLERGVSKARPEPDSLFANWGLTLLAHSCYLRYPVLCTEERKSLDPGLWFPVRRS